LFVRKKMKRKKCLLVLSGIVLLIIAVAWLNGVLIEKTRVNFVSEHTQTIVFVSSEDSNTCRLISDEKSIRQLRKAYRWTNRHMFCCMEKPLAYLDVIVDNTANTNERSEYYASLWTNSYNLGFRYLLHQAWNNAEECSLSVFNMGDESALQDAQAILPGCFMYKREEHHENGNWKLYVVSSQSLTMKEKEALQKAVQ